MEKSTDRLNIQDQMDGNQLPSGPAHTSSSEPGDRLVDLALRNDAALNSVDDCGDLGLEIGVTTMSFRPEWPALRRSRSERLSMNGIHGQIVSQHDPIEASSSRRFCGPWGGGREDSRPCLAANVWLT